jgi:hypothetical protein
MASFDSSIFQEIVDQNWEQVKLLVSSTDAVCETKDEFGFFPLHVSLQDEAPEDVQLVIIKKYPKGNRFKIVMSFIDTSMINDLSLPVHTLPPFTSEFLNSAAAELSGDGDSALLYALRNAASLQVTQLLLDIHPGAVSAMSDDGDYPLHVAIQYGAEHDVVEQLILLYPEGKLQSSHALLVFLG